MNWIWRGWLRCQKAPGARTFRSFSAYRGAARLGAGVAVAALLGSVGVEAASHPPALRIFVSISLTAPPTAITGDPFAVSVAVSSGGVPVAARLIRLYADGVEVGAIETNAAGDGAATIRTALTSGTHTITATFRGGGRIQSASASRTISVSAAPLSIRIVPYIPNSVTITVNGGPPLAPNADGFVVTNLTQGGKLTLDAVLQNPAPNVRVTFVSWSNNDLSPVRTIDVRSKLYTQLAVQASYLTKLRFEDSVGHPLGASQVKGLRLVGPDGQKVAPTDKSAVWLSTPVPRKTSTGALAVGADVYTMTSALFNGVNVADQGVDRYVPGPGGVWAVRLSVYPVKLFGKNVVLGGRSGVTIALTGPRAEARRLSLSAAQGETLQLPTGHYKIRVVSGGVAPSLDIRVSRATSVPIPVVTTLDIIAGLIIGIALVTGLIMLRPWRRLRRGQVSRATQSTT